MNVSNKRGWPHRESIDDNNGVVRKRHTGTQPFSSVIDLNEWQQITKKASDVNGRRIHDWWWWWRPFITHTASEKV